MRHQEGPDAPAGPVSRREFFRSAGRAAAVGALAALGGALAVRAAGAARRRGGDCRGPCAACPVIERCYLPAAVARRRGLTE